MTYEEKITKIGDYDIIIRTPIDILDEKKKEEFKFLSNRISEIIKQIELHEDYDDVLADKKRLDKITDILIDRLRVDADKRNDFARDFENKTEEEFPWG